jgi:hypothetical protein
MENENEYSMESISTLKQENAWFRTVINRFVQLLQVFGMSKEEIEEELEMLSTNTTEEVEEEEEEEEPIITVNNKYRLVDVSKDNEEEKMSYYPKSQQLQQRQNNGNSNSYTQTSNINTKQKPNALKQVQNGGKKEETNLELKSEPTEEENRKLLGGPSAELTDGENREVLLATIPATSTK